MTETTLPVGSDDPPAMIRQAVRLWEALPFPRWNSPARIGFDLLFGAAVPVVLFHLDLRWLLGTPLGLVTGSLIPYRPYPPVLAFACVAVLLAWYPKRNEAGWVQAVAAGPLLLGGAFAFWIGALLLPFSLLGALAVIGLLGLLPFLTAFVFADAGFRALAAARGTMPGKATLALALLAATTFGGACLGAGRVVRLLELRATAVLAGERDGDAAGAEARLRLLHLFPGVGLEALQWKGSDWNAEGTSKHPEAKEAWERITGRTLQPSGSD